MIHETAESFPAFSRYRILAKIGEGGSGFVYRAVDEVTGGVVALKTARDRREVRLQSIRREIESLRQLRHSGIVRIFDGGVIDGKPWYSMELLEGATLWWRLSTIASEVSSSNIGRLSGTEVSTLMPPPGSSSLSGGRSDSHNPSGPLRMPLTLGEACGGKLAEFVTLFRRICVPLAYLHGERYVHRDLKPSNVFIRSDGTPVLMDFGLAVLLERELGRANLAIASARAGTLGYIAPEQLRGTRVDARADLFALGCMMYEAVTGRLPFAAQTAAELSVVHASRMVDAPSALVRGVPDELEKLILDLLAIKPRERVGHTSHVVAVLDRLGAEPWPERPDPRPRSYLYRPELTGREVLAHTVQRLLDKLGQGTGGLLLLSGESGIGKTSALVEVARLAEERGIRTVAGECVAVATGETPGARRSSPLNAFHQFLTAVADRCAAQGPEATRTMLGANASVLATCEPALAELPGAAAEPPAAELPAEASRRRLFEALESTLSAYAEGKPLVLIIDDVQWADDLSTAFMQFLPPTFFQQRPMLFVLAHRTEEQREEIDTLGNADHVERFRLDLLDQRSIRLMAEDMLAERGLPDPLVRFLFRESAGNPFLVSEYLRTAADHGLLIRDALGRWRAGDNSEDFHTLPVPGSLRDVLLSRLDRLSPRALDVLGVAAVLGREADLSEVASIAFPGSNIDEEAFSASLHELRGRDILVSGAPGRIRFAHDKLREVAYDLIAVERRRELHDRAGVYLEASHPTEAGRRLVAAELAHHFEQAGDTRKAAVYWQTAAEVAHRTFANRDTLVFIAKADELDRAAGIVRDPVARARRERLMGEALLGTGDSARALDHLLASAKLVGFPFPSSTIAVTARAVAEALRETGRRLVSRGSEAERTPAERARILEATRVYQQLPSVLYYVTGDTARVLCANLINLSLSEKLGPSEELATAVAGVHMNVGFVPLHRLAEFYGRLLRTMMKQIDDETAVNFSLLHTSAYAMGTCQWDVVRADTDRMRRISSRIGFHRRWEEATAQLGTTLFMTGDIAGAKRVFGELSSSAGERGDNQTQAWALVGMGQIRLVQGDIEGAGTLLGAAEKLLAKGLTRAEQIYTLGPLALCCLRMGDDDRARRVADACAAWIRQGPPIFCYTIFAYASAVGAYWGLLANHPHDAELADAFHDMVRELKRMSRLFPAARAFAAIWEAVVADAQGKRPLALRQLSAGREDARRYGQPLEEALAELGLAALGTDDDARRGHERQGREIADRLGVRLSWPLPSIA